jgi:hypothetical protein
MSPTPSLIPVLADHGHAIGCLLKRGKLGWENANDRLLGIFKTAAAVVDALLAAASPAPEAA